MKKLKFLFITIALLNFSCSSDSNNSNEEDITENLLEIDIEISGNQFEVDKPISFNIISNQNINEVCVSFDNWDNFSCLAALDDSGLGFSKTIYTSFDQLGLKTINTRITNLDNEIEEETFQIEIIKGSSVKINRINLISFSNINGTWDPEFSGNDALADLKFALVKTYITTSFDTMEFDSKTWYISDVLMNQGNLTWDLSQEELYIDPNLNFGFGLGDNDGGGIGQDLLLGPPFEITYSLQDFINEQPNSATLIKEDIDLEVEFELVW